MILLGRIQMERSGDINNPAEKSYYEWLEELEKKN